MDSVDKSAFYNILARLDKDFHIGVPVSERFQKRSRALAKNRVVFENRRMNQKMKVLFLKKSRLYTGE